MAVAQNHSLSHSTTALNAPVTRDVQDELAQQRAEKRRRAGGSSPIQFHKDLLVGDDWTCMFLKHIARGVSMHEFEAPPENVLDLGCGSGLWVIEAAQAWPEANLVGFDLRNIQPDLTQPKLGIECRDLSKRIQWIHGDFLDPLPFDDSHFDLVRICCIGLDVPEDHWQELLEECSRVLKCGGAIEVIEEDSLFPAGRTRKPDAERLRSNSIVQPSRERMRSDSSASKLTTLTTLTTQTNYTSTTTHSSITSGSSNLFTTDRSFHSVSLDSVLSSSSPVESSNFTQDHAQLKRAWEEMLGRRFLTHKLLTVLPFYMSSFFTNVNVHPTMHILLPPPSYQRDFLMEERDIELEGDSLTRWLEDMRSATVRVNGDPEFQKASSAALRARPSAATVTSWSALHLARQVRLISACKEAVWEAYRALELEDQEPSGSRGEPLRDDLRERFEREWDDWEDDMKDRMGVRNHIQDALSWRDSDRLSVHTESFRSSQTRSRKSYDRADADFDKAAVCRAMRGFLGWKLEP